jgi:hypothetical protein
MRVSPTATFRRDADTCARFRSASGPAGSARAPFRMGGCWMGNRIVFYRRRARRVPPRVLRWRCDYRAWWAGYSRSRRLPLNGSAGECELPPIVGRQCRARRSAFISFRGAHPAGWCRAVRPSALRRCRFRGQLPVGRAPGVGASRSRRTARGLIFGRSSDAFAGVPP